MEKMDMKRYYKSEDKNEVKPAKVLQSNVKNKMKRAKHNSLEASIISRSKKNINSSRDFSLGFTDNDLAMDNIANDLDLTAADIEDLRG